MKSKHIAIAAWLVATVVSTGCRHRDFCYDHPDHAPRCIVELTADYQLEWELPYQGLTNWRADFPSGLDLTYDELLPKDPSGLRVLAYTPSRDDAEEDVDETNMPAHGGLLYLTPGTHSLLFYNNDTEYIKFEGLGSFANAIATTRSRSRVTYKGNTCYNAPESRAEETVAPPDQLFGTYMADYKAEALPYNAEMHVTLHPIVYTYVLVYNVAEGIDNVLMARGAMAGMARGVRLDNGHTTAEPVTVLYEDSKVLYQQSRIVAHVKTFGIPDFPNPDYVTRLDAGRYALNLEVALKTGKMVNFDFDVTEQMQRQPQGGVIIVGDIKIPEQGDTDSSAFDVNVEGWGEYQDIDIPL